MVDNEWRPVNSTLLQIIVIQQLGASPLRRLRQQALNVFAHPFILPFRPASDPHTSRTQFRELDKEAVEVRPQCLGLIPNCLSGVDKVAEKNEDVVEVNMDRDLQEVSVFGRYGFECLDNPQDGVLFRPKHSFCQFRRIGEVDRNRAHTLWFRGVFRSGANLMAEDGVYVAAYDLLESRDRRVQGC